MRACDVGPPAPEQALKLRRRGPRCRSGSERGEELAGARSQLKLRPYAAQAAAARGSAPRDGAVEIASMQPTSSVARRAGPAPERPRPACRRRAPRSSPGRKCRCGSERRTRRRRHKQAASASPCSAPRKCASGKAAAESAQRRPVADHTLVPGWRRRGRPRYSSRPRRGRHRAGSAARAPANSRDGAARRRGNWRDRRRGPTAQAAVEAVRVELAPTVRSTRGSPAAGGGTSGCSARTRRRQAGALGQIVGKMGVIGGGEGPPPRAGTSAARRGRAALRWRYGSRPARTAAIRRANRRGRASASRISG